MKRTWSFCALLLAGATVLRAQAAAPLTPALQQFVAVPEPVVALTHVRVVDGTGAAPAEDQTIVIQNGSIVSVGASSRATVPAGARVLDLSRRTVTPGFVGLHDHM